MGLHQAAHLLTHRQVRPQGTSDSHIAFLETNDNGSLVKLLARSFKEMRYGDPDIVRPSFSTKTQFDDWMAVLNGRSYMLLSKLIEPYVTHEELHDLMETFLAIKRSSASTSMTKGKSTRGLNSVSLTHVWVRWGCVSYVFYSRLLFCLKFVVIFPMS